jgi:Staphylococcal nuclease homologue
MRLGAWCSDLCRPGSLAPHDDKPHLHTRVDRPSILTLTVSPVGYGCHRVGSFCGGRSGRTAQVWLEYDPSQGRHDRYGRVLAYVWLPDGLLVNEEMAAGGFAHEYTYEAPYKYRDLIQDAERGARFAGKGLWSEATCAGTTR